MPYQNRLLILLMLLLATILASQILVLYPIPPLGDTTCDCKVRVRIFKSNKLVKDTVYIKSLNRSQLGSYYKDVNDTILITTVYE